MTDRLLYASVAMALATCVVGACKDEASFDPASPGRGPGTLVGNGDPVSDGDFTGGSDSVPTARAVAPPAGSDNPLCDTDCRSYCDGLNLDNPVNRGMCTGTWGVGLDIRPVDNEEACRRLFIDLLGRVPSVDEATMTCNGRPWGEVVADLMARDEFVAVNQRDYADFFRYDTESVSVEAIFDLDALVGKAMRGLVSYDQFAAVASAHPAVTRRYATAEDIAEAVFTRFLGRPPFPFEKADFGNLFRVWSPGYINHKPLGMRLPDAFVGYPCVDDDGNVDPNIEGQCTSTLFGFNQVILTPDYRAAVSENGRDMWSGILLPSEWQVLQTPGRALTSQPAFWEKAVQDVVDRYLGYQLGGYLPEVRAELVNYLLSYNGDIRAVHYAVATSFAYLQSSQGTTPSEHVWTSGPRKQLNAEEWFQMVTAPSGQSLPLCDHRITRPYDFLEDGSEAARSLVASSRWQLNGDNLQDDYAELVQTLGGCPTNGADFRFRIVSILTTSTQLNFVNQVCDPARAGSDLQAAVDVLLPAGVTANAALDADMAEAITTAQVQNFLGRSPTAGEITRFREAGTDCAATSCSAEEFARISCFTLLTSAEALFY